MNSPTSPLIHLIDDDAAVCDSRARERFARLSEREREVLAMIVAGLTEKDVGRSLSLSPRTVETHRANLFAKLEAGALEQVIRRHAAPAEGDAP